MSKRSMRDAHGLACDLLDPDWLAGQAPKAETVAYTGMAGPLQAATPTVQSGNPRA